MTKLVKTINKFNGNLCFSVHTEDGFAIFECIRSTRTFTKAIPSKSISGMCLNDADSYLVVFSDNWIGRFSNGVLDEEFIDTGLGSLDQILKTTQGVYYVLDKTAGTITRLRIE